MRKFKLGAFVAFFLLSLGLAMPVARGTTCSLQLNSVNYPSHVSPGQELTVTTSVSATCSKSDIAIMAYMDQMATPMAARLQVQVGGLIVNYYVAYDSEEHMKLLDTLPNASSRSVFLCQATPYSMDWGRWLPIDRDIAQDFEQLFGFQGQEIFQQDQVTVTIALEFIGFGTIHEYQTMLWDNVEAIASVVSATTNTAIQTTSATTSSASSTTSTQPMTLTTTLTETSNIGLVITSKFILLSGSLSRSLLLYLPL